LISIKLLEIKVACTLKMVLDFKCYGLGWP